MRDFLRAKSVKDAVSKNSKGYSFFAGGTEIMRLNSGIKTQDFISLKDCSLAGVEKVSGTKCDGGGACDFLKIGAMCGFQQLIENPIIPDFLKVSLKFCSSLQKRYMATIGGNIASLKDDSYIIPTLIAADAELEIFKAKKRISLIEYGEKYSKDERDKMLITSIYIPLDKRDIRSSRIAITQSSSATLTLSISAESFHNFRIAAAIKTYGIVRLYDLENYLSDKDVKNFSEDDFEELMDFVKNLVHLTLKNDLIYGSAKYKKYLLAACTREILEAMKEEG